QRSRCTIIHPWNLLLTEKWSAGPRRRHGRSKQAAISRPRRRVQGKTKRPAPAGHPGAGSRICGSSLLRHEELVDLLLGEFALAVVGVDDQGGAARRHPHEVIAQAEHVL